MNDNPINVLLIEDNPGDVRLIREMLLEARDVSFNLERADRLESGLARLAQGHIDVILLDLTLPDSQGLDTLAQVQRGAPGAPILLLTGLEDETLALKAVQAGAQDYLTKGELEELVLTRAIRYALERVRGQQALRDSEERYRRLVELLPDGIIILCEGRLVFMNAAGLEIIGASRLEDVTGRPVLDFIHPDYREIIQRRIQQVAAGQSNPPTELKLVRLDGATVEVEASSTPYTYQGKPALLAIFRDITERKQAEEELKQRAAQLALINDIGSQIAGLLELDGILKRVADLIQATFDYHHVALFLKDGARLKLKAVAGSYKPYFPPTHTQDLNKGINGWVARHGQKLVANDVSLEPRYISLIAEHSVTQAELCLPIKIAGQTVGILDIQSPHRHAFGQNDIVAMEALTHQIAAAIENARLYQAIQTELNERKQAEAEIHRRNRELTLLNQVIASSMETLEIEAILDTACRELARAFELPRALALLFNAEKQEVIVVAEYCPDCPAATLGLSMLVAGNPLMRTLLTSTGPVVLDKTHKDTSLASHQVLLSQAGEAASLLLPIRVEDEIWGSLILESLEPRSFAAEEMNLAWSVADQVAGVLARARLNEERQRTELILRQSEERFRQVVSSISDHIYMSEITLKGEHLNLYVSPNIETLTGYPRDNFMADPKFWALTLIHPDDQAAAAAQLQRFAGGHNSETEYRMIRADGQTIWVRDSGKVQPLAGSLIIYGVVSDITERKRAEAEVQMRARQQAVVAELGQSALAGVDVSRLMEEAVTLVAQTLEVEYCKILEYWPERETLLLRAGVGWRPGLVGQAEVPAGRDSQAGYTLLTNEAVVVEDLSQETRFNGPWLLLEHGVVSGMSVVIYGGAAGHPYGVLGVHTTGRRIFTRDDVHFLRAVANILTQALERKQAQAALEHEKALLAQRVEERTAALSAANAELAQATRLKDEFLANMSHELRTPLNVILGMSEVLRENIYGPLTEEQLNALNHIEEGGRHLLALINDILDLSKIEAGKLELDIASVEVENVCQASLRFIKQIAQKKRIKIFSALDQSAATVQADERRLKQILVNLLSNAVKFTPEGGEVSLKVSGDAASSALRFTVTDSGIGIAREDMTRLFKPFVQLDSKLSRQHEGTGLGLSLVARLVELHGGSVAVESIPGQGSSFTISLPWPQTIQPEAETVLPQPAPADQPAGHALIIEDSVVAADLLARYLAEFGLEPAFHQTGETALERVKALQPRLILLDLQLPDLSGWEVLARLKADPQTAHIPVIVISVADERSRGLEMGAADYLVKPISRSQFRRSLQQIQADEAAGLIPPNPAEAAAQAEAVGPPSILLAEDNEANIHAIKAFLGARGYHLIVARNGEEAIQRARETRPAIILMDIQMPLLDGLEATRRLRADTELAATPIIALTALAMPGDRERCLAAGADDYLSKPISMQGLAYMIEQHLRKTAFYGSPPSVMGSGGAGAQG
jgi:PAS domain S-box-containing protein